MCIHLVLTLFFCGFLQEDCRLTALFHPRQTRSQSSAPTLDNVNHLEMVTALTLAEILYIITSFVLLINCSKINPIR